MKFSRRKMIIIISGVLVISWMLVLFNMSSQIREDSNNLSKGITQTIIELVEKVFPDSEIDVERFNHIIRKNAHFFAYLLLGILVSQLLRFIGVKGSRLFLFSLAFCVLYAISDEIHQYFVPGRGPQIRDVFIDSTGSFLGILVNFIINHMFVIYLRRRLKINNNKKI